MFRKALLVVNFHSGTGKARTVLAEVIETLAKFNIISTVYVTRNKADTVSMAEKATECYDMVIAIGGDGTLSEIVNGVMRAEKNIPVGYIPTGSTNDTARSLGITTNPKAGAEAIATLAPQKYDIGMFNQKYFVYIAATGAFTKVSYATSQSMKNALGHLAYVLEGIKSVSDISKMRITGSTDRGSFDGEYLFCSISNSTSVGGIIQLDPGSVFFNDGRCELCLISAPQNGQDLMQLVGDIMQSNFENKLISIKQISKAELTIPSGASWTLDGEDGGKITTVSFEVPKKKLLLLSGSKKITGGQNNYV